MKVQKRNGTYVDFNKQKIIDAINKAMIEVDGKLYETDTSESIANEIAQMDKETLPVETIQDLVEEFLMQSERLDVAKAYIRYRYKKEVARQIKADFFDAIGEKLEARNVQNQNANIDEYSFGGRIGEAASLMTKEYALDNLVSPMARANHEGNMVYIHDLDHYAIGDHNCLSIPFDKLLAEGFNTRQTDVRPANSVNTAMQLVAVIFQLQSLQQFGGVSATHLDWTMVPYVRKSFRKHFDDAMAWVDGQYYLDHDKEYDDFFQNTKAEDVSIVDPMYCKSIKNWNYALSMTEREVYQAVEGLYHNLNTLQSRSGN